MLYSTFHARGVLLRPLRQVMQIGGGSTEIMKDLAAKQAQY